MAGEEDAITLSVLWRGIDDAPVVLANQFVAQHDRDQIFLTFGQLQPPILLGSPEERMEQAKRLSYVPVNVVARLALTRERLGELIDILRAQAAKYDETHG